MSNKKVNPSEDFYDFLPKAVQESTKIKTIAEKNVLASLCYQYLSHSNYAKENEGWFYCSLNEILEGCGVELAQLKRVLIKLSLQKLIERQSGTNHHCTHYRLHHKIVELLPKVEGDYAANEPLIKTANEPLVKSTVEIANEPLVAKKHNEPLDKTSIDKTSQVKTSLIVHNTTCEKEEDLEKFYEQEFSKSTDNFDVDAFYKKWKNRILDCKDSECLKTVTHEFCEEMDAHFDEVGSEKGSELKSMVFAVRQNIEYFKNKQKKQTLSN